MKISFKEIAFGIIGTLIGGVFVWSLTSTIELRAQLKALELINPQITRAIASSSSAETASQQAIDRANNALQQAKSAEHEVNRILTNLNATPLFKNIDESIEELKQVAATIAREEAALDLPLGTIVAWHKSLDGTPNLPSEWVECNGQKLNDRESLYHNTLLPRLNNQVYAGERGYYLRGGMESGLFNESTYFTDNGKAYATTGKAVYYGASYGAFKELDREKSSIHLYDTKPLDQSRRVQTAAMTVVWIIKVK